MNSHIHNPNEPFLSQEAVDVEVKFELTSTSPSESEYSDLVVILWFVNEKGENTGVWIYIEDISEFISTPNKELCMNSSLPNNELECSICTNPSNSNVEVFAVDSSDMSHGIIKAHTSCLIDLKRELKAFNRHIHSNNTLLSVVI